MTTQVSFSEELMNKGLSDQNPIILTQKVSLSLKSLFKFFNAWAKDNEFFSIVHNAWATPIAWTKALIARGKSKQLSFVNT